MPRWKSPSVRQRVLSGFVLCLFFASCLAPNTALAQTSRAMVLLGQFAVGVATTVAGTLLAKKAEAYLESGQKAPQKAPQNDLSKPSGYQFTVQWIMQSGLYKGTLTIRGGEGTFRVASPRGQVVDQDITARSDGEDVLLVGRNPRSAFSPSSPIRYSPDTFRLVKNNEGNWAFADVCDAYRCAPVHVADASTF